MRIRSFKGFRKVFSKEMVGSDDKAGVAYLLEEHLAKAGAHGFPDQKSAGKNSNRYRDARNDRQVGSPVIGQGTEYKTVKSAESFISMTGHFSPQVY